MNAMLLKNLISTKSSPLQKNTTLFDAIALMQKDKISSVVVVDESHKPLGIFTEHDILKTLNSADLKSTFVDEMMSTKLFCMKQNIALHDAYMAMEEKKLRHLIVVDDEGLYLGVVSEGDFLRQIGFENLSKEKTLKDLIYSVPLLVDKELGLQDVAARMHEKRKEYALIVEENIPQGLVTQREIAKHLLKPKSTTNDPVNKVAHSEFKVLHESGSLHEAGQLMKEHGIHQLIVVNDAGAFVGVIDRHSVLKEIHGSYFELLIQAIENKSNAVDELLAIEKQLLLEKEETTKNFLKFQTLFNSLPDGCVLLNEQTQAVEFNTAVCEMLGYTSEEFASLQVKDYELHDTPEIIQKRLEEILAKGSASFETQHKRKDGTVIDVWANVSSVNINNTMYFMGIFRDTTAFHTQQKELHSLTNNDPLTNLFNRNFLLTYLKQLLRGIDKTNSVTALIIFDLDHFKDINDSFGHSVGDELLKKVALRLQERVKKGTLIARLGGDEFAVILDNQESFDAIANTTQDLIQNINASYTLSNELELHIGVSAGVALAPTHTQDAQELLQFADAALYRAKEEGRGIYRFYTDDLTNAIRERVRSESNLRHAIENREFELFYQPQVHIASGRIVGAEALIRWRDPVRGLISPTEFIPIAEDSGLIGAIGEWVLYEACRQGKKWQDKGHRLTIAVNLSAHQLHHQDILQMVDDALKSTDFVADKLELELTESALMQREEEAVSIFHALRAKGVRLAIDDFGTGYSSLSYLKRFPLDVLKIDKSFIDDIPYEADDNAIVSAIIAMGTALGFQILAEGTEHREQIDFLREKGCTMYQGYYKSPPLPADDFEALL